MAERTSPFDLPPDGAARGVTVTALPRGTLWQVACWADRFAAVEHALGRACGVSPPRPGRTVALTEGRRLIRVEPLKWWIAGPEGAGCPVDLAAGDGAVVELGHEQAGLSICGPRARDVLARLVPLDLRPGSFPDGAFATTGMHHLVARLLRADRDDVPRFELSVMRSHAGDLGGLVRHHLHMLD